MLPHFSWNDKQTSTKAHKQTKIIQIVVSISYVLPIEIPRKNCKFFEYLIWLQHQSTTILSAAGLEKLEYNWRSVYMAHPEWPWTQDHPQYFWILQEIRFNPHNLKTYNSVQSRYNSRDGGRECYRDWNCGRCNRENCKYQHLGLKCGSSHTESACE